MTLKINNFKSLVSMRYSTTSNKKIDVTNKISNYYFLKNNKELLTLQMLTKEFNKFLHLYISYFCGRCEGKGHHKGIINGYLQYILSDDGQEIVPEVGYVKLKVVEQNSATSQLAKLT